MLAGVSRERYGDWLACSEPELARAMLAPFPAELMQAAPAPVKSANAQ